jgi:hypothetical protein
MSPKRVIETRVTYFPSDKSISVKSAKDLIDARRICDEHVNDAPLIEQREVIATDWVIVENPG